MSAHDPRATALDELLPSEEGWVQIVATTLQEPKEKIRIYVEWIIQESISYVMRTLRIFDPHIIAQKANTIVIEAVHRPSEELRWNFNYALKHSNPLMVSSPSSFDSRPQSIGERFKELMEQKEEEPRWDFDSSLEQSNPFMDNTPSSVDSLPYNIDGRFKEERARFNSIVDEIAPEDWERCCTSMMTAFQKINRESPSSGEIEEFIMDVISTVVSKIEKAEDISVQEVGRQLREFLNGFFGKPAMELVAFFNRSQEPPQNSVE